MATRQFYHNVGGAARAPFLPMAKPVAVATSRLHQPALAHRFRLATPVAVLPFEIHSAAAIAAVIVLGLPASVLLDELLDTASPRVNAITNADANGVRLFVARPHPTGGSSSGSSSSSSVGGSSGADGPVRRRPAVVLIHQILGLQRREVDLAQALADEEDVVVVAPDTFRGQSTRWPFRAITLGFKYALRGGASWGVESVHEAVTWSRRSRQFLTAHLIKPCPFRARSSYPISSRLKSQPDVDPTRIVVGGFCYGGGSAVRYAVAHPGEVVGVTIFYGRPLLEASEVAKLGNTPILGLYGTKDAQFSAAMLDKFKVPADMAAAGVPHRLEMFAGEGHAFVRDLTTVRQGNAAGRSWQLFREFIRHVASGERPSAPEGAVDAGCLG